MHRMILLRVIMHAFLQPTLQHLSCIPLGTALLAGCVTLTACCATEVARLSD